MLDVDAPPLIRRNSSDPNLAIVSVYSPDTSTDVQVVVNRSVSSSAKSSKLFTLFKLPKRRTVSVSTSHSEFLKAVEGTVVVSNTDKNETTVEVSEKQQQKQEKSNRFLSFIRYVFCQFIPNGSNAIVTPTLVKQTTNDNNNSNEVSPTDNNNDSNEVPTTKEKDDQSKVK